MIFIIITYLFIVLFIGLLIWDSTKSSRILRRKEKQLSSLRAEITSETRYYDEIFKDGVNHSTPPDNLGTIPLKDTGLLRKNK